MGYFINYILYLVQDHSQGESEPGSQFYFTPNSLNRFGIKMKGRWGGKAATDRADKEGEIGQRVAKAYHISFCSPNCYFLLPQTPHPQVPDTGRTPKPSATILVWGLREGAANLSPLPTAGVFSFGDARAGVKLCLELADTALGAKVYSWRRD